MEEKQQDHVDKTQKLTKLKFTESANVTAESRAVTSVALQLKPLPPCRRTYQRQCRPGYDASIIFWTLIFAASKAIKEMATMIDPDEDYLTVVAAKELIASVRESRKKDLDEAHANLKGRHNLDLKTWPLLSRF